MKIVYYNDEFFNFYLPLTYIQIEYIRMEAGLMELDDIFSLERCAHGLTNCSFRDYKNSSQEDMFMFLRIAYEGYFLLYELLEIKEIIKKIQLELSE